jgi:hypothetical protein
MNPFSLYEGLQLHFRIMNPQEYLCQGSLSQGKVKLDLLKLDDHLHKIHGDYEDDGLSMSMLITQEYGQQAHTFVTDYL